MGGPTWIWIHGWGMLPGVWGRPERWAPEVSHRFFSYAGCGTIGEMKRRLLALIREEAEKGERISLIGWSMGGMLALELSMDLAEGTELKEPTESEPKPKLELERLILIGATLRFAGADRSKAWPERIVRRMQAQLRDKPEETLRQFADSIWSESERARWGVGGTPPWPSNGVTDFTPTGLSAGLGYLLEADLTDRWRLLTSESGAGCSGCSRLPETVWLHGTDDPICPFGALEGMRDVVSFPGAGHALFLTERQRFEDTMRRWIGWR